MQRIVEYIRYQMTETGDALIDAYRAASVSLQASPHCLAYELTRCSEDPTVFMLRIEWDSAEGHMQGFRRSAEFRAFYHAVAPFVPNIVEMRHYDLTDLKWSREQS